MAEFKESDLQIFTDGVLVIKRVFGPTKAAEDLVAQVVRDLAITKSVPFSVDYIDGWWLVSSARDWLLAPSGAVSLRSFKHVVHFPEAGEDACHSEILLTAYASAVVTRGSDRELIWISGDENQLRMPEAIHRQLMQNDRGRSVAFRGA